MKPAACMLNAIGAIAMVLASFAAAAADPNDTELIKRGQYLATAGDCVACHSVTGGKPYAGGLGLPTPIGSIISTNITPSKTHGIGNYTLAQFSDAMRRGIRADGERLYPAMPYTSYAVITDEDMAALYAYFMHGVTPVDEAPPATSLPLPFNIRQSMAAWNLLFLTEKPFQADASKSEEWNRGAYLTRGLAHCSTCHTPRNFMMAEDISREFAGGEVGTWHAPNISPDPNSGIGGWSTEEITRYLRTGHAANKAQAGGPMAEAIDHSLRHLTEDDLRAIAVYLKSVPAMHDDADTRPAYAWGAPADDFKSIRGVPLPADLNLMTGPQLYDAHCATCHQAQGQGSADGGLPPLFHNAALGRSNPNNLVMVILEGVHRQLEPAELRMPGFAETLSDTQVATLATYLTQTYGNPQVKVSAEQVKSLRAGGEPSKLVVLARAGIAAGFIILLGLILFFWTWHRRKSSRT